MGGEERSVVEVVGGVKELDEDELDDELELELELESESESEKCSL